MTARDDELDRLEQAGYLPQTDNPDCTAMFHLDCGGVVARGYEDTHDRVCPANRVKRVSPYLISLNLHRIPKRG